MLSHSTEERVEGPPAISVSDATVQEAEGATLEFSVTLSHASSRTVTVSYATQDGTATAGLDYTATSATLTFNAGDLSQTVEVTVLTDSEDEGQETLTLTLSNPSQATLGDGTGTGTIENGESSSGTQEDPPAEDPPVVLLTASFSNMPATHNGSEFTFDLAFSEDFPLSYVTLRDDAFTVDGGNVENAQRKVPGQQPDLDHHRRSPTVTAPSASPCPRPPTATPPAPSAQTTNASCRTPRQLPSQDRNKTRSPTHTHREATGPLLASTATLNPPAHTSAKDSHHSPVVHRITPTSCSAEQKILIAEHGQSQRHIPNQGGAATVSATYCDPTRRIPAPNGRGV